MSVPVPGQSETSTQAQRTNPGAIQAAEDRQKAEKEAAGNEAKAKPVVMNVDVQMVLAKAEYKTFAEAKAIRNRASCRRRSFVALMYDLMAI